MSEKRQLSSDNTNSVSIGIKHQRETGVNVRISRFFIDVRTGCVTQFNPKLKGDGEIGKSK